MNWISRHSNKYAINALQTKKIKKVLRIGCSNKTLSHVCIKFWNYLHIFYKSILILKVLVCTLELQKGNKTPNDQHLI